MSQLGVMPSDDAISPSADEGATPLRAGQQWFMVCSLTLLGLVAAIDRNCVAFLLPSLKRDLHLSDTELSLATGTAFIVFNTFGAILCGWLSDRFPRKPLLAISAFLWSVFTMIGGVTSSFASLTFVLAMVGLAEGSIQPAAFSMIRGGVSIARRGRALAIFGASLPLGGAAAALISGVTMHFAGADGRVTLPLIGTIADWRAVLAIAGAVGIPAALLITAVAEPRRVAAAAAPGTGSGYREVFDYIVQRRALFAPLLAFAGLFGMVFAGFAAWNVTILTRNLAISLADLNTIMGPVLLSSVIFGVAIGGFAIDRFSRIDGAYGPTYLALICLVGTGIVLTTSCLTASIAVALTCVWLTLVFGGALIGSILWLLARLVPQHMAGKASVLFNLVMMSLGFAIGPVLIGAMSDRLPFGDRSLGIACAGVGSVLIVLSFAFLLTFLRAQRRAGRDGIA